MSVTNLEEVVDRVRRLRPRPDRKARLLALSGIDGSGKGYVAGQLARRLEQSGMEVALINIDGWLNLPAVRFGNHDRGKHFYQNAFRFEEMFASLVEPLAQFGSIHLEADYTEETASSYRKQLYSFRDVDTVLLEGIFLLRRAYRERHDLAVWVDCSFETALERAIARAQEGLPPAETIAAYESIYFPAQREHFAADDPRAAADLIYVNDARLYQPVAR